MNNKHDEVMWHNSDVKYAKFLCHSGLFSTNSVLPNFDINDICKNEVF